MKLLLLTLEIVMVIVLSVAVRIFGYDRQCPHSSQRGFRVHSECSGNSSVYNCLYNTKNKTYTEFCEKNEEARAGLKYVISGTYRNVKCSEERYQPFTFWTNRSTYCLYLKSPCSETGQLVFDNTSTIGDSTCRCDYTRHYAFLSLPRNPCFCKPSVEDCSCYIKQCPNNTTLSPDYECRNLNSTEKSFNCNPVIHTRTSGSDIDTLPNGTEQFQPQIKTLRTTLAVKIVCICIIAVILVVMYVIYDRISEDRRDLIDDNGKIIESDHSHAHNINIENQSSEACSTPNDNSSLSESDITVIREYNTIENNSLIGACQNGDLSKVISLIKRGVDINITDSDGDTPLSLSCMHGHIDIVNLLIDKGCDIHKPNIEGKTPLMNACYQGHLPIVARLIEREADINITDNDGDTALSLSCFNGNIDIVNLLIDKGCDIHKRNIAGKTPLMNACLHGHLPIVARLIEREADINITDNDGDTALSLSCYNGHIDIVNLLIDKGCDIHKPNIAGKTPLMYACLHGHLPIVSRLIEREADINTTDNDGDTALSLSCFNGNIDIVNLLIDKGCDIHKPNIEGKTPLMNACYQGHLPIVARLIERGADINTTDKNGNTTLSLACYNGNIDIVNLLIDKGCDIHKPNIEGKTPLMNACYQGHLPIVARLIEREADINITDNDGDTALSLSCFNGNIDIVNLLIDQGCDIHKPNIAGKTPLMNACLHGHLPIVARLIEREADINITDNDGDTALSLSYYNGHIDIVNLLIDKGCDIHKPNIEGKTPLMNACLHGHLPIVALLIERGADINTTDNDGDTALSLSCFNGHIDIVNLLIDKGCDIHKPNIAGKTPLMYACYLGHLPIVARLIERGADINTTDNDGDMALSLSCFNGHIDIVNLLIDKGWDIHKPNIAGKTPLMNACLHGHLPIVSRLIEREADINTTDNDGDTALSLSCFNGHIDIVNLLIDKGCDIHKPNNNGTNPVMNACYRGHLPIVSRLIERGADINTADKNGNTPFSWASENGKIDVVNLLIDKGYDINKADNVGKPPLEKGEGTYIQTQVQEQNMAENPEYLLPFAGSSEDFNKLLSTGTYESFENRVFLCGSCACGKSTLASVLIGSTIPLTWKSTDGLVIHFGRNGINLETHEMVPLTGGVRDQNVLTKVVIGKPNRETVIRQSVDTNRDRHIAPSSTDFPKSNQQTIKKDTDCSFTVSHSSDVFVQKFKDLPVKSTLTSDNEKPASVSLPKINKIEAYAVREDILKEIKSGQYKIKIAPSDLVDFGGQRSYDMTHQLFVQHGGTFVVMFDGSKDFHEPLKEYPTGDISNETIVKHWVNSILTYCVDESDVDDPMPMIVFAATHSDLISQNKQEKMKKEFAKEVTDMFGTHEMNKHIVFDPVYFINGTDKDDHEIKNLKNQLVSIAVNQSSWGQRRPMIWVPLELLIDNMKKDKINVILKTHLAEANTKNGDLSLSDKQLDDFLLTQHALGKIMYFNQPNLNNFIVIYPPALVNILRSFITDEMFWPTDETLKKILRKMTNTGRIRKCDLLQIWQQKQVHQHIAGVEFKEFVIQVLVHLDVLVVPKRKSVENDADVNYFLVPCTIKNKMPMTFLDDKSFDNRTISLVYRLQKRTIPSSLAFKLIGAVSSIWPIKEENGRPLLYHSAAVLYVDSKTEFRIIIEDTRVIVYLTHIPSKFTISPDIAASIQECLTFTLNDVLKFYLTSIGKSHTHIDVSNLFQIEVGEVCDRSPCVLSISEAKRTSSWDCCSRNQHCTKYPLLWLFDKTQEECPTVCTGLHNDALAMLPSDKHIVRLASQLDIDSCKKLVLQLGLQDIHCKKINHVYSHDDLQLNTKLNTMMLYTWMNTKIKGKSSTKSIKDLHDGLKAIGANLHVLCKVFREYTDFSEFPNIGPDEVPNDDILNNLPQNLGNCALQLGVELGISINSIEQTKTDYRKMYDQTADILRKWKNSTDEKPTVFKLLVVLERVHLGGFQFVKDVYLNK
ncbi:uncharacterized protein LOC143042935 [Mytilus galloprovincialis]|uniref:uncharacterized protein LOC143042935 n=1 Tax=Mytilus galloprovincialis TaxID=29158 RepID=UPI003F7CBDE4